MDAHDASDAPFDDGQSASAPSAADGMEHLQSAARELVAAARSFLDVVEHVIEDDERFAGAASSVADLVTRGLGTVADRTAGGRDLAGGLLGDLAGREPSWLRNDPDAATDSADTEPRSDVDTDAADAGETIAADDLWGPDEDPEVDLTDRPAPTATPPAPRTRRVKRIAVD